MILQMYLHLMYDATDVDDDILMMMMMMMMIDLIICKAWSNTSYGGLRERLYGSCQAIS